MPEYRAYAIGADGHIHARLDLTGSDVSEATEQAKRMVGGHDLELWQGGKRIATFFHKYTDESDRTASSYEVRDGCMIPKPSM